MKHRVFVYGTLKRGQRNFHFLNSARFLGHHLTEGIYSMYDFEAYPAVCLDGSHAIEGEVYGITARQFRLLDDLEWYPHFYQRIEIETEYGDAWMYIVKQKLCRGKRLIGGVWR